MGFARTTDRRQGVAEPAPDEADAVLICTDHDAIDYACLPSGRGWSSIRAMLAPAVRPGRSSARETASERLSS
jgi:hypothetical protein